MTSRKTSVIMIAMFLVLSSSLAVIMTAGDEDFDAETTDYTNWIKISTPEQLSKIGSTAADTGDYPINGKYVLTKDIDFTNDDRNGGFDLTIQAVYSASKVTITLKVGDALLTSASSMIVSVNGTTQEIVTGSSSSGAIAIEGKIAKVVVGGEAGNAPGSKPVFAAAVTFNFNGPSSQNKIINSNGNMDPLTPVDGFEGVFHGNGYKIIGLNTISFNPSGEAYNGLFARIGAVTTFDGISLDGGSSVSTASASALAGGLIGFGSTAVTTTTTIANCYNTGDISASTSGGSPYAGGLFGIVAGEVIIKNSYNTGNASVSSISKFMFAGGLGARSVTATITNCYNTGDISASAFSASTTSHPPDAFVGGLIGQGNSNVEIRNSYNAGALFISSSSARPSSVTDFYIGGLIGRPQGETTMIIDSYNTGDIFTSSTVPLSDIYAGGLVGGNDSSLRATITNCYNVGKLSISASSSNDCTSGLIGRINTNGSITNCYFYNNGDADLNLIGYGTPIIDGSDGRIKGHSGVMSLKELQNKASYFTGDTTVDAKTVKGWDFENVWNIDPLTNNGLPTLRLLADTSGGDNTPGGTDGGNNGGNGGGDNLYIGVAIGAAIGAIVALAVVFLLVLRRP